jgi:hypothetical protein
MLNDLLNSFIGGLVAGAGMFLASAIFGYLLFRLTKPWLTKTISEIWTQVRTEGIEVEVKIDGKKKLKTDKGNKKKHK